MITTVITTTTTLTTVTAIAAVVSLIVFLTIKELIGASSSGFSSRVTRFLNVGILPLLMVFAVILAIKIAEVL